MHHEANQFFMIVLETIIKYPYTKHCIEKTLYALPAFLRLLASLSASLNVAVRSLRFISSYTRLTILFHSEALRLPPFIVREALRELRARRVAISFY